MPTRIALPVLGNAPSDSQRCPSAQPDMEDARVLGIVEDVDGRRQVAYIDEAVPVTPDLLDMPEGVEATEVLRFSARCDEKACMHFDGSECRLASRVIDMVPAVVDALPPCTIRPTCRWYQQEGREACLRCPQIITLNSASDDEDLAAMAYGPAAETASDSNAPPT